MGRLEAELKDQTRATTAVKRSAPAIPSFDDSRAKIERFEQDASQARAAAKEKVEELQQTAHKLRILQLLLDFLTEPKAVEEKPTELYVSRAGVY